MTQNIGTDTPR